MPPARGCSSCRTAKVKCDGQRPTCQRCIRLHLQCEGYRDANALIVLDETAKAAVERRPTRTLPASSTYYIPPQDGSPWLITPSRSPTFRDFAIARYFANYVIFSNRHRGDDGYMADLPWMFAASKPGSTLQLAVEANSLLSIKKHSLVLYNRGLAKLREDISDPTVASRDETLMAILLLHLYELLSTGSRTHVEGLLPILQLRGPHQTQSLVGWNLFRIAHRRVQFNNILKRERPHPDSLKWISLLNSSEIEIKIASLALTNCTISFEAKEKTTFTSDSIEKMIQQDALCSGLRAEDEYWDSSDLWVITTWNYHRSSHLLLLETLIQIRPNDSLLQAKARALIQACLDSIPLLLRKEVGFYFAMVVLDWISSCTLTTPEERNQADTKRSHLRQVNRI